MEEIDVNYSLSNKGIVVRLKCGDEETNKFSIMYPKEIWQAFPKKFKKTVVENFVFLSTSALPTVLNAKRVKYNMNSLLLGSFFIKPFLFYIPFYGEEYNSDIYTLLKRFLNTRYSFNSYNIKIPDYNPEMKERSINLFTFGKDSLVSYAISEEIGLNPVAIYVEEPDIKYIDGQKTKHQKMYENLHKDALSKRFKSEFGKDVYKIKDQLGIIRSSGFFNSREAEICYGSDLSEFALLSLPFNHHFKAKYIVYGNEASCNGTYMSKEGFMTNPVFDQSHEWNLELSKILKLITKKITTVSMVEPVHELFITRILHYRYPQYAKYQMSCFAETKESKNSRWCHNCSKCARIYTFLKANNIDPKIVEFKENMFSREKKHLYSIFGLSGELKPYDYSGLGIDEMLYGFYLAYKNGAKGHLINLFKKKYLDAVQKREKELFDEYYVIHTTFTLPARIKKKILNIYKEEQEKVPKPQ